MSQVLVTATGSNSGMRIYVDGKRMILARTRSAGGTIDENDFPLSGTVSGSQDQGTGGLQQVCIAMPNINCHLDYLWDQIEHLAGGANLAFDVALTRVFNRPLSDSEVFQNFIGTIPSNATISNFKIG